MVMGLMVVTVIIREMCLSVMSNGREGNGNSMGVRLIVTDVRVTIMGVVVIVMTGKVIRHEGTNLSMGTIIIVAREP